MSLLWLLGAPDPEMSMIDRLLRERGQTIGYATVNDRRVTPAQAYAATGADPDAIHEDEAIVVECAAKDATPLSSLLASCMQVSIVDHHRPGDPGYGAPPAQYWQASSIGQVCARLGIKPTTELLIVAAADHCLAAAYRGHCPGVNPGELMTWRAASRAAFQGRTVAEVLADIERAREALRCAPHIFIAGHEVSLFETAVPELPEAAARDGRAFLATLMDRGQKKLVLQAAPPEVVSAWMAEQAAIGRKPYGDPARGFAGVILE